MPPCAAHLLKVGHVFIVSLVAPSARKRSGNWLVNVRHPSAIVMRSVQENGYYRQENVAGRNWLRNKPRYCT